MTKKKGKFVLLLMLVEKGSGSGNRIVPDKVHREVEVDADSIADAAELLDDAASEFQTRGRKVFELGYRTAAVQTENPDDDEDGDPSDTLRTFYDD